MVLLYSKTLNFSFSHIIVKTYVGSLALAIITYIYTHTYIHIWLDRVEAGKNTSTVIPASHKRRQKGNLVITDETVIYGYDY
jgi:hypothetical protein